LKNKTLASIRFIKDNNSTHKTRGIHAMLVCEICGMEAVEVSTCSKCEAKFCKECGDAKSNLCYDCQGWESENLGEGLDEEDWDRSWEGNEPH
jgi:hypothetical protein